MAQKVKIGDSYFETTGGKTRVNLTNYIITKGKTRIGVTNYEIRFNNWDNCDSGLEFTSSSYFELSANNKGWEGTMEYCNGEGWKPWNGETVPSGENDKGQCIYVRGTGNTVITGSSNFRWVLDGTNIECNGNIEKLLDYSKVIVGEHPELESGCFNGMFSGCKSLVSPPDLGSDSSSWYCYASMFEDCVNLQSVPKISATVVAPYCYNYMFSGCTSLKSVPTDLLPAKFMQEGCYRLMFNGCTSLENMPNLPATQLATSCYDGMFTGCTSLTTVQSLPAETLYDNCYICMFSNCISLKNAPSIYATRTADYCCAWMFVGCKSLIQVPALYSQVLAPACYMSMFEGCKSIYIYPDHTGIPYYHTYTVPMYGGGTYENNASNNALMNMLYNTIGGLRTPTINTAYRLNSSKNTIV